MAARKEQTTSSPPTKISETFLAFVSPLTETVGKGITKNQFEQALKIGFTVWNSVVFDAAAGNDKHVSRLRRLISHEPVITAMIEWMIRRKKEEFPDDQRLIGEYTLTHKNGEWRLRAEARSPSRRD